MCFTKTQGLKPAGFNGTPPFPPGEYDVIYADPPWCFDGVRPTTPNRLATNHYTDLKSEDIYDLTDCKGRHITAISTKDAVLFLWGIDSQLLEALQTIKSWGFKRKNTMVWDKEIIGLGNYFRMQHEYLFVCTKGKIGRANDNSIPSILRQRKDRKHSKKPHIVYNIIERMYPNRKYIELFARNHRPNWTSWGNEIYMKWVHETKNNEQ